MPSELEQDRIRAGIRANYALAAASKDASEGGCCGVPVSGQRSSRGLGYDEQALAALPGGADLGLGCGNPTAIAGLQKGEVVVDLGSGGGIDCFLAGDKVGPQGHVIGVDMTPEMLAKARANAAKLEKTNVEFRLGEIEHLPVADASADVVISNCVINLSPDKLQVYKEALRVLKPGGRFCVSDVIALQELPSAFREDQKLRSCCVSGAVSQDHIVNMLHTAGFGQVEVRAKPESRDYIKEWSPGSGAEDYVVSADIVAVKPTLTGDCCQPGPQDTAACCGPEPKGGCCG